MSFLLTNLTAVFAFRNASVNRLGIFLSALLIFSYSSPRPLLDLMKRLLVKVMKINRIHSRVDSTACFPAGWVVKHLPASSGDMCLIPDLQRSHMRWSNWARVPQLLSLCSKAQEPQLLSLQATVTAARMPRACARQQGRPRQWEADTRRVGAAPVLHS